MAFRLIVIGVVQGVGFRPFVAYLAEKHSVKGYVRNLGGGEVEIWAEGQRVREFIEELLNGRPSAIEIEEYRIEPAEPRGYRTFEILKSEHSALVRSQIPPDLAVCDACLKEYRGGSRRTGYPFISCSWCGPRFAVMRALPYDRERTSWDAYPMCLQCAEEYRDLKTGGLRRFFYQGISCQHCGPSFRLLDSAGSPLPSRDPLRDAIRLISEGYIVAVKSVGGFHLAALADDDQAVLRLRERKKRPRQPFAVMALEGSLEKLVYVDEKALSLLKSPQRPIVLLPKREGSPISKYVSPGLSVEGIFLPYTAYHYDLLEETRGFLVMTSGNRHGSPTCKSAECIIKQGLADYILDHGLEIAHRVDDSVIRLTDGEPVFLRRSRGYAPRWIRLKKRLKRDVVAFGADLATAGAIGFEDKAVLTQYIGDLDDFDTLMELDAELRWFVREYRLQDAALICDKNPAYNSRRLCREWAEGGGAEALEVQHHHAHALSVA
ncbi:MAG: carbamoyltransferase HypF, partial [Thermoproteus sp.]